MNEVGWSFYRAGKAYEAMREALKPESPNEYLDLQNGEPEPIMNWPSTLSYVDENCGGFYGLTTLAAAKGTGKTMLALASGISAAASGNWQVCYFAAEDDRHGLATRFNLFMNAHPECAVGMDNFHIFQTGRGQRPHDLTIDIAGAVDLTSDVPILVIIDSLNSLVEMSHYAYLDGLTQYGLWAMMARRISGGNASFLLVSETNKNGEAKGAKLPYWSDQVIMMKRGAGADIVEMTLDKSRRTGGVGEMGKFIRIWKDGCFVAQGELEAPRSLRVVGGGEFSPDPEDSLF
jgi:hypothetical protein